jgi:putative hydrolase
VSDQPGEGEPDQPEPKDPLSALFEQLFGGMSAGGLPGGMPGGAGMPALPGLPSDPQSMQAMFAQVQQLLTSGGEGPVNWDLARQSARAVAAEGGDPSVGEADQRTVAEALRTADLWLDRVCELPAATARSEAWSRAEWVERTMPTWQGVVEPVATRVGDAMAEAVTSQMPEQMQPLLAGALPMMRRMGGAFFGHQLGQALGHLAGEVVGSGDVGLPLLPAGHAALVPANIEKFGEGLGLPMDEVRLYLALREAAHARLFAGVPWLRAHLLGTVEEYARGIRIDTERIEAAVRDIEPGDPQAIQEALSAGLFEPQNTPAQAAALERLETALALVEGWIDAVVDAAARSSLPHATQLREVIRRRRAAGGPAEHTFATLVGLELRPRRLREAAAVWEALAQGRGVAGRDALWQHPDLVPGPEAFADPAGFAGVPDEKSPDAEAFDAALEALLEREGGEEPPAAKE